MALGENDGNEVDPSRAFPFDAPLTMDQVYEELDRQVEDQAPDAPCDERDALRDDRYAQWCGLLDQGVIYRAHEGCGMYSVLVVNGAEYGNVWYVDVANDAGVFPLTDPAAGGPLRVFPWFTLWLDAALDMVENHGKELESYAVFIP